MTREEAIAIFKGFKFLPREMKAVDMAIKALEQEPTTKNDLAKERYQDLIEYFGNEKVAKTVLENRKEFKAWLERLRWNVKRADELARELEQIKSTTKNDLGVKLISKSDVDRIIDCPYFRLDDKLIQIMNLPPVTPQEPKMGHWIECMPGGAEEWCYKCSECNFWKYKKFINLSKFKFCPNCGSRNEVEE